jgi:glucose-6-phosphate dehydrogenase assembly protein OpcA
VEAAVIVDLPATTSAAVARRLVDLRDEYGAVALGRVLTLVAVVDGADIERTIAAAAHASHEHPLRVIVVQGTEGGREHAAGHPQQAHLDAQVRFGRDAGAGEVVVLWAEPLLVEDISSLVMPLLLADAPVVAWWPGRAPTVPAETSVGALAHRRITDSAACDNPLATIRELAAAYQPGDADLAWGRLTLWRAALVGAVDALTMDRPLPAVHDVLVSGSADSPSVDLLAAWLADRMGRPTKVRRVAAAHLTSVEIGFADGTQLRLQRPDGSQIGSLSVPGQPTRPVAMSMRSTPDCLAEELRWMEPDEVYGEVLQRGLPRVIPA